jgi:hypothetical protein
MIDFSVYKVSNRETSSIAIIIQSSRREVKEIHKKEEMQHFMTLFYCRDDSDYELLIKSHLLMNGWRT